MKHQVQFPKDTLHLPATEKISWTNPAEKSFFFIFYTPLDTLNYGKYLDPATNELNRRTYHNNAHEDDKYEKENTFSHPVANRETSIVWSIFKFFGKYKISVYSPDANMFKKFIQMGESSEYNPLLATVKGAQGYFGSASVIRDTAFVLKNQP